MRGLGRVYKRGGTWWIAYYHRGPEYRESTQSGDRTVAAQLLKVRLGELTQGKLLGPTEERVTYEEIEADFLRDYEIKGRRSARWARSRGAHLRTHFGTARAIDITTPKVRAYVQARLADLEGATPATINRDLAALGRMFTLAIQAGRLSRRPHLPKLQESQPRQGFMEHADYVAIRQHLPPDYQDLRDFGYYSGWRRGEITSLEWRDVERNAGVIRLRPERSKTNTGRVLVLPPPLRDVIERRWRQRALGCPYVFQMGGHPIGDWRKTWWKACKAAERPGALFHDLRRTAVRNLVRAGVPERVAMTVTGHKTRSVFDRYNIVSETDLAQATSRLAEYVTTQSVRNGGEAGS